MRAAAGTTTLGFIGLGVMGKAMARNLLKAGFSVTVHNRSPAKVEELVAEGAVDGRSPAGVGQASEIILTCVPDTPDLERVLFGEEGLAHGLKAGGVMIDMSTVSAAATRDFAERLEAQGIEMLDSPVSGGPQGAVNGTLSCMVGGKEEVLERCRPVLEAVGKTIAHIGPSGAGQLCKSCNQLVIVATMLAAGEAVALCRKLDIDPERMRAALSGGAAASFVMDNHVRRMINESLAPGFRAALMLKDLKLTAEVGRGAGVFMPTTALGVELLGALCQTGRDGLDSAAVTLLIQELSGLRQADG